MFCQQCQKAQLLNHMTSLTISINYALLRSAWMKDIPELVSSSPLEYFHLYSTPLAEDLKGIELDDFVTALISTHGLRLRRLSIHRLPISLKTLHNACVGFTNLEQLFTVVRGEDLVSAFPTIRNVAFRSVSGIHRELLIESHQTPSGSY